MDPNRSQKRIYTLADEKGVTGLNNILRLMSEDIATLQGQNGPAKIGDRYDLTSERNDTNLTLKSGTDFNTDMAQFKSADGTVRSRLDNQGRYWNQLSSPWNDLVVPLSTAKAVGGAATDPNWVNISGDATNVYGWEFSASQLNLLLWTAQLPHDWKEGSPIYPHVHWWPTTTNTGNAVWGVQFFAASVNTAFPATAANLTYNQSVITAASGTARMHQVASLPACTMPAGRNKISTILVGNVYRLGNSGDDTFTGTAIGLHIDFHYEVDSMGSRAEFLK